MAASGDSENDSQALKSSPSVDSDNAGIVVEKSLVVESDDLIRSLDKPEKLAYASDKPLAVDSDIPDGALGMPPVVDSNKPDDVSDKPPDVNSDKSDDESEKALDVDHDAAEVSSDKLDSDSKADVSDINVRLQDKKSRTCGGCAEVTNVGDEVYCLDCQFWLCSGCKDIHGKWQTSKHHRLADSPADDTPNYSTCETHPTLPVKYFCLQCTEKTCPDCQLTDHYLHESSTLESRVDSITEDFERVIQKAKDLIEKYANNVDELTKQKNDFTLETRRLNNLLNEEKQALINEINQKCERIVSSNNRKLADFTEDIDKKLAEIRQEISANETQLCDLQEQQSTLTIASDLSSPNLPEINKKEIEAITNPNITKCPGNCVTDGVIRCTLKNVEDMVAGRPYYSEEIEAKQSLWKLQVKRCYAKKVEGRTLGVYVWCDIESLERSWPVTAAFTIRLLHPDKLLSKEYSSKSTFEKKQGLGWDEFHRWKEMTSGGYVENNEIVVELEVHPQTADGVACLCQNKHIWHTEINIPENPYREYRR